MKHATALLIVFLLPCCLAAQYSSVNRYVTLNGSGYLSVPNHFELNMDLAYAGRMSIDAWVKPSSTGTLMAIVGNDAASGYWFGLSPAGKLRFKPAPNISHDGNATIPANVWTHVGVFFDIESAIMRFYVNGSLDRSVSVMQGWIGYTYSDLRIGADRSGSSPADYWRGSLDEVRIWKDRIDFSSAAGALYRIPHAVEGGLYGQDLVSVWRLNNDGSDPVGGHHASAVGGVSYETAPDPPFYSRIGVWLRNGSGGGNTVDHLQLPYASGMDLYQNYTIEMWVKWSSTGGHAQFQTLICRPLAVAAGFPIWLGINKANNRLRFVPNGDIPDYFESTAALTPGKWTHVAARLRGSGNSYRASLFIDGLLSGEKAYASAGAPSQAAYVIGASSSSPGANFVWGYSGMIDELRLWTTARSDLEIADNYRREFGGPAGGLTGAYHFDGDVLDASGNGHDGANSYAPSDFFFYRSEDLPSPPALALTYPKDGETLMIGDPIVIRWSSSGLRYISIDLSRDAGATWSEILLSAGDATAGQLNWTVTGPPSGDAHIRVRTPTPTGLEDRATKLNIREPPPVMEVTPTSITMKVSQNAPIPPPIPVEIRNIGGSQLSWTAFHSGSPWLEVLPFQGSTNLDTFWVQLTTTNLAEGQYAEAITIGGNALNRGMQIPVSLTITAKRVFSVSGLVADPTGKGVEDIAVEATGESDALEWSDPDGHYLMEFLPSGDYTVAPRTWYFTSTPAERTYTPLNNHETGADFMLSPRRGSLLFRYHEGWNLVSIPLHPDVSDVQTLFPDAVPPAYAWDADSGYVVRWDVEATKAYWIKFARRDSIVLSGVLIRDMHLSYQVWELGWNLFGMPSGFCAFGDVEQLPPEVILQTYEHDPYYGYILPVDGMLAPGKGYFVKVGHPGEVTVRGREEEHTSPARSLLRYPGVRRVLE